MTCILSYLEPFRVQLYTSGHYTPCPVRGLRKCLGGLMWLWQGCSQRLVVILDANLLKKWCFWSCMEHECVYINTTYNDIGIIIQTLQLLLSIPHTYTN